MTHLELVIERREFQPYETHFFTLFFKPLSRHKKHMCQSIKSKLNSNETPIATYLTNEKKIKVFFCLLLSNTIVVI